MASGVQLPRKIAPAWRMRAAKRLGVGHAKLQVLGRDAVRQRRGLGEVAGHDDGAVVAPACARDGAAVQRFQMALDGGRHRGQARVGREEDRLRAFVVFGLAQEVERDPVGVAVRSAITRISDGPAIMSMPTCPKTGAWRRRRRRCRGR
jgi:hypothetical protein